MVSVSLCLTSFAEYDHLWVHPCCCECVPVNLLVVSQFSLCLEISTTGAKSPFFMPSWHYAPFLHSIICVII